MHKIDYIQVKFSFFSFTIYSYEDGSLQYNSTDSN